MKKFYVGLMAGVLTAVSAHAADEPVVIGEVTMPAVESSGHSSRWKRSWVSGRAG